jgi:hypothetical protein
MRACNGGSESTELKSPVQFGVSCESQSEEGGSGPWLGSHGQKSHYSS